MEIIRSSFAPAARPVRGMAIYGLSSSSRWFAGVAVSGAEVLTDYRDKADCLRAALKLGPGRHVVSSQRWEVVEAVLAHDSIGYLQRDADRVWVSGGNDLQVVARSELCSFLLGYTPMQADDSTPLHTWAVAPPARDCRPWYGQAHRCDRQADTGIIRFCRLPSGNLVRIVNGDRPDWGSAQRRHLSCAESIAPAAVEVTVGYHHWKLHVLVEHGKPVGLYSPGMLYRVMPGRVHAASKNLLAGALFKAAMYGDRSGLRRFEDHILN